MLYHTGSKGRARRWIVYFDKLMLASDTSSSFLRPISCWVTVTCRPAWTAGIHFFHAHLNSSYANKKSGRSKRSSINKLEQQGFTTDITISIIIFLIIAYGVLHLSDFNIKWPFYHSIPGQHSRAIVQTVHTTWTSFLRVILASRPARHTPHNRRWAPNNSYASGRAEKVA